MLFAQIVTVADEGIGSDPSDRVKPKDGIEVFYPPKTKNIVSITSHLDHEMMKECFDSGLEQEHRFLVRLCEKGKRLGTICEKPRKIIHKISYDPIFEGYRVAEDMLGDGQDPTVYTVNQVRPALERVSTASEIPLSYLREWKRYAERLGVSGFETTLGVRVKSQCRGETSEVLKDLSYVFTFGMVDLYGYDSGWKYFTLSNRRKRDRKTVRDGVKLEKAGEK